MNVRANILGSTYWWIDRKSGVAGVVFLNMLPYMDPEAVKLWVEFQTKIYKELNIK
jgi:methyl acetate hydrolase